MHFVLFTHSLVSCWNHGNAHFLRGIMRELFARGHTVLSCEPEDGWSRGHLLAEAGQAALDRFHAAFPELAVKTYGPAPDLDALLEGADAVLVHEWTDPALVAELGRRRSRGGRFALLFHDTHHRAVSASEAIAELDLDGYDAVLAFGAVLADRYARNGWGRCVFTWHEAADTRLFRPLPEIPRDRDLVWIGNWGDGERSGELLDYLVGPARRLALQGSVYGVRYPQAAIEALTAAGLDWRGWIANTDVPAAFARHRATVHIPRRPYREQLPGIPTIRVFEALACGIPLVCAPWSDVEGLFRPGEDYLTARSGQEMAAQLRRILEEPALAGSLARSGLERIRSAHSCSHRVDELLAILHRLGALPRRQLGRPGADRTGRAVA